MGKAKLRVVDDTFDDDDDTAAEEGARLLASPDPLNKQATSRLRSTVERLERLEEDKQAVMTDMKEVFAEAKGEGFDVKILRKVIRLRKQDRAKRQEEEALVDLYMGHLDDEL